jgi:pimeloyl-ACP methyl ester carboxylesterase
MKITFQNKDNKKIIGTLNIVDKKSASISIIIHGFSSNKDRGSKKVSQVLSKNKINNLAIDLDNRGESEPIFEDMTITKYVKTILCAVNYCQNKKFTKINVIGTSSGALSAMALALKYPKINSLNSLILRSASPSDAEWFKEYVGGNKGIANWKKKGYILYSGKSGTKKIKYAY